MSWDDWAEEVQGDDDVVAEGRVRRTRTGGAGQGLARMSRDAGVSEQSAGSRRRASTSSLIAPTPTRLGAAKAGVGEAEEELRRQVARAWRALGAAKENGRQQDAGMRGSRAGSRHGGGRVQGRRMPWEDKAEALSRQGLSAAMDDRSARALASSGLKGQSVGGGGGG